MYADLQMTVKLPNGITPFQFTSGCQARVQPKSPVFDTLVNDIFDIFYGEEN